MENKTETFEERLDRKRKEAAIKRARLAGIISALGFAPDPEDAESARSTFADVRGTREDGAGCQMAMDGYQLAGRVSFTAWAPRLEEGVYVKTPAAITMSAAKTDAQIIADVQKRYLPALETAMLEYVQRRDAALAAKEARGGLVSACAAALSLPVDLYNGKPRIYEYPRREGVSKIEIETDYKGVEARINLTLSPAFATSLCRWLAQQPEYINSEKEGV